LKKKTMTMAAVMPVLDPVGVNGVKLPGVDVAGQAPQTIDIRNLPTSGLDSGSAWLDGVNGILMQQEPDLPAGLLESKGYCFPCQHLNHSRGASS
jgi:hypothetical protein